MLKLHRHPLGVRIYVLRRRIAARPIDSLLAVESLIYAVATMVALFFIVRLRVGLTYSRANLLLMLTIYALAALPFFTGGLVITLAISGLTRRINAVYAADLIGAAAGSFAGTVARKLAQDSFLTVLGRELG